MDVNIVKSDYKIQVTSNATKGRKCLQRITNVSTASVLNSVNVSTCIICYVLQIGLLKKKFCTHISIIIYHLFSILNFILTSTEMDVFLDRFETFLDKTLENKNGT